MTPAICVRKVEGEGENPIRSRLNFDFSFSNISGGNLSKDIDLHIFLPQYGSLYAAADG
jgi:hypothetical protein